MHYGRLETMKSLERILQNQAIVCHPVHLLTHSHTGYTGYKVHYVFLSFVPNLHMAYSESKMVLLCKYK